MLSIPASFFLLLFFQPGESFLWKFSNELALLPAELLPTFECTLHYHQVGSFEGGLSLLGEIHGRLESSPVSWLVYTEWPNVSQKENSHEIWDAAVMLKRHQSWCSIIFYFDVARSTLQDEFYQTFSCHIYRIETIFIFIRDTMDDYLLRSELYSAPCLVFVEFYRINSSQRFAYLRRNKVGVMLRAMRPKFSVVSILQKSPSLEDVEEILPGIVPTKFIDFELGKNIINDNVFICRAV